MAQPPPFQPPEPERTRSHLKTMGSRDLSAYWRTNLRYLAILLSIWFTASFGFGILLAPQLNTIQIGGFKVGFWFAQQGSIYIFVLLIFVYTWLMNRLDRAHGVHEGDSTMKSEVH